MGRIISSNADAYDFCNKCMPTEEHAKLKYGNIGDGPDGRGNCFVHDEWEHPDYDDTDYRCHKCNKKLTSKDN